MPPSSKSRKRQARLTFNPLPSSSPAAREYNEQIQHRAAAVRYETASPSPAKRRRLQLDGTDEVALRGEVDGTFLPTPALTAPKGTNSSYAGETGMIDDDSDELPLHPMPARPKSTRKATQQKLNLKSTADPSSSADIMKTTPAASLLANETDLSSEESDATPRRSSRKTKSKKQSFMSSAKAPAATSPQRRNTRTMLVPSDSEDQDIVAQTRPATALPQGQEKGLGRDEDPDTDDDDDDMPTSMGTQRRGRKPKSSPISSSPPAALSSDDDVMIVAGGAANSLRSELGSSDDDGPVTPRKRRLQRPRQLGRQEQEDLDEDLEFLGPSSDVEEAALRTPRDSQTVKKSAKQRALEDLKRKRSGQPPTIEPEASQEEHESSQDQEQEQDEIDDDDSEEPFQSSRSLFQATEDDENFLVDDEDGEEGVLGVPDDIPLEFTRYASMKAKELFKFAIEWMVQKKINPAFRMDDDIYNLTFKKLDDEVKGLVGSKFASSAWTIDFTMSLRSRPSIEIRPIDQFNNDRFMLNHCDACNRSNHPATYEIQFQGKPYNRHTLDDVEGEEDDEDEDGNTDGSSSSSRGGSDHDDLPSYDANGREVPAADKVYYVGRFCLSNAETAHELQHWRLHLYDWVVQWLEDNDYSTPQKVVERDRWSTKKRRKHANKIADKMEKKGVVKQLWKEFRDSINRARESKQERWN